MLDGAREDVTTIVKQKFTICLVSCLCLHVYMTAPGFSTHR
jgi:hypothetical protein